MFTSKEKKDHPSDDLFCIFPYLTAVFGIAVLLFASAAGALADAVGEGLTAAEDGAGVLVPAVWLVAFGEAGALVAVTWTASVFCCREAASVAWIFSVLPLNTKNKRPEKIKAVSPITI
jgi:hypothetical protein